MKQVRIIKFNIGESLTEFEDRVNEFLENNMAETITYHVSDEYLTRVFIVYEKRT